MTLKNLLIILPILVQGIDLYGKKRCITTCCPQPKISRVIPKKNKECCLNCSKCCYPCGTTTFIPRSQGANTARELIGWQHLLYQPYYFENYVVAAATTEYTHSLKPCRIANSLFCTDCLTFSGSQVSSRNNGSDVIADNFGLSQEFRGTLSIRPSIINYIVDFNFYFGLDELARGFYFRIHAPLTHTKWSLGLDECVVCSGKSRGRDEFKPICSMFSDQPADVYSHENQLCYIDNALNPVVNIPPIIDGMPSQYPYRCTATTLREALSGNYTFGDMTEKWKFGKFDFCTRHKTTLADLDVIMGWNFCSGDFGHLGLYALAVVPTGSRPKGKYIFEPIAGNGKHWELGGGLTTHYMIRDDGYIDGYKAGFYLEGNITYVFKNEQIRAFDFKQNGLLSRYMLLKEYDLDNNYIGRMINAINFATRNADVHVGYKIDASAKIMASACGWVLDLGYNIFARQAEKVCIKTECPCDIDQRRFAIKGIAPVCTLTGTNSDPIITQIPNTDIDQNINNEVQIPATDIPEISPDPAFNDIASSAINEIIDNKENQSMNNTGIFDTLPTGTMNEPDEANTNIGKKLRRRSLSDADITLSNTSQPTANIFTVDTNFAQTPTIISCADLDPNSAAQCKILTHKFFWHLARTWFDKCYQPHLGIGGEIEFNGNHNNISMNQWGIWLKGGIIF